MNIIEIAIKRPVFISCIFIASLLFGVIAFKDINVDTYPNVTFPIVVVTTTYDGATPKEIESLITKPLEENIATISGIETMNSVSITGLSTIVVSFNLNVDINAAKEDVRDKVQQVINLLPKDLIDKPVITNVDPNAKPVAFVSVSANVSEGKLYELLNQEIQTLVSNISGVGRVDIFGGRERQIHILVEKQNMFDRNVSASAIVNQLTNIGKNIPGGVIWGKEKDYNVRTVGRFDSIKQMMDFPVVLFGNDSLVTISDIGTVVEGLEDEVSKAAINGKTTIVLQIYKASDANTIVVVNLLKKFIEKANPIYKHRFDGFEMKLIKDNSKSIKLNLNDVYESIGIGIILTFLGVFIFLGNMRSTLITAIAIPNSLICAFILINYAGYTINIMTLLALNLSVGLLIDDAIVVRENIFKKIEAGMEPKKAAFVGSTEILLPVIATTFAILSVFLSIAFLSGIVGEFFKSFGFTVCFIMIISLLDALTMAPMLSAYFGGKSHRGLFSNFSEKLQESMIEVYQVILKFCIKYKIFVMLLCIIFSMIGFYLIKFIPKTFVNSPETGEFIVSVEMPQGTDLQRTYEMVSKIDKDLRSDFKEVELSLIQAGGMTTAESNIASIYVSLVPKSKRKLSTSEIKSKVRKWIKQYKDLYSSGVTDADVIGGASNSAQNNGAFTFNIVGIDLEKIQKIGLEMFEKIKYFDDLLDADISFREGLPELRVSPYLNKIAEYGINANLIGQEIKTLILGNTAATYTDNDYDMDVIVKLPDNDKNLENIYIPNINGKLINLKKLASIEKTSSESSIYRANRLRYVSLTASVNPHGKGGINKAINDTVKLFEEYQKNNPDIYYTLDGQAKRFKELGTSIIVAMSLAIIFMYLILASLYESFRAPFLIMLILPFAISGGFYGLFITGKALDLFAMIGCIMLLGVAAKNSILLLDRINYFIVEEARSVEEAILEAGKLRIRPIMMTSIVLILGMLPIVIGLNEASSQRTAMGVIVIFGLISSTLLTLVFLPSLYAFLNIRKKKS